MRGGLFLYPLHVDPADAAAADTRETLHSVTAEPAATTEPVDPQRLATLIRSTDSLGSASEATEINADVLNSLPKWAQAVVQTGCFHAGRRMSSRNKLKRNSGQQSEIDYGQARKRPRRRRSSSNNLNCDISMEDEASELQEGLDELNMLPDADSDMEEIEIDDIPTFSTKAEITADSVEKYAELLEKLIDVSNERQQLESFERDGMNVFQAKEVKILRQSVNAIEKNDWMNKLEPELLISVMSSFDAQVRIGLAVDVFDESTELANEGRGKLPIDEKLVLKLLASLDVAICELTVMSTPEIDRRVLSEDIIDNCFQLLHQVIRRVLLPCIDTSYMTTAFTPKERNQLQSTGGKTTRSSRINLSVNKGARKAIDRVSHLVCDFMDQFATLVMSVKLADRWIMRLSSSMVELFALEHSSYATSLQQSALGILRGIFLQYQDHRDALLGDIVDVMVKLPTTKRTLRTVKLQNSKDVVQRITTLVVSIIQSCAARKFMMESDPGSLKDSVESSTPDTVTEEKSSQNNDAVLSTLDNTRNCAKSFVRMLLRACWKKTEDRDNRLVLDNFVEDLLVMFVCPEWIGAEELLVVLSSSLASILHANISADVKNPDSHHSLAALTLTGQICTAIKRYQKKDDLNAVDYDSNDIEVIEEHIGCLREVFTGKRTGKRKRSRVSQPSSSILHQIGLKHIVVMHLQRYNDHQSDSRTLILLKFISESKDQWGDDEANYMEQEKKLWESQWGMPAGSINSLFKATTPSSTLALKSSLHLAVKREFCSLFDRLLAHVMALLSKGMPSLRARVMKCLRGIVDVDPMLMAEDSMQVAVERCCSDEKPSVREAAVDLIGTYVLLNPSLFDKYFDVLAGRLRDKGIKVRKSVCKIFKTALISMQERSDDAITVEELRRKSACMRCLVERVGHAAEDQGIKNFIIDTFQEVWFGSELSTRLSHPLSDFGDGNTLPPGWSVVTTVDENPAPTSLSVRGAQFVSDDGNIANSVEEAWCSYRTPMVEPASLVKTNHSKIDNSLEVVTTIVEVIHGMPNLGWFAELLKRLLAERNTTSKKQKTVMPSTKYRLDQVAIAENRSEKIIDRLVECLIGLQEGALLNGVSIGDAHQQFLSCMTALSVFCKAKPQLLAHHLETICVYLKEEDVKVQSLSVTMINNILNVKRAPQSVAGRLEKDLELLVLRSPPSVVGPSIQCLATLSATRKEASLRLLRLLEQFFHVVKEHNYRTSLADLSEKDNYVLQRALFASGKIVGATDIDKWQDLENEAKVVTIGTITASLYTLYANFIRKPGNDACVAKAVQGMGFLFPLRPRLFLQAQQDGLLTFLLTTNAGRAKLQCLISMKELLQFEEQRLGNGLATRTMNRSKSKEQQVQGDQEADASLIGNVMQAELEDMLLLSLHKVPQIRKEAVACISALITQGLVNPSQCIPNLVALETDRIPEVRDAAFSQLLELYERFRNEFRTPSIKGIQNSYAFQLSVYNNATSLGIDENKKEFCLFGRLYRKFLTWTKSHESPFLNALVKQFTDQGSVLKLRKGKLVTANSKVFTSGLKYLCYLAQIISTLPYIVEDEPLYIIYSINRYVSLRLGPVLDDLRAIFAEAGIAPELLKDDESDLTTLSIDKYQPFSQLDGKKLVALQVYASIAFAIGLMLRLKFALKRNYQLDNDKCATYKPSTPDAALEAKERSPKKLLLPSVDDLCQTDDPIKLNWNLFIVAWYAAREDQKQLDVELEEAETPKPAPKRRRRSRRAVLKKKASEDDSVDEDEDIEGFA